MGLLLGVVGGNQGVENAVLGGLVRRQRQRESGAEGRPLRLEVALADLQTVANGAHSRAAVEGQLQSVVEDKGFGAEQVREE